jgi:hypothetical protein
MHFNDYFILRSTNWNCLLCMQVLYIHNTRHELRLLHTLEYNINVMQWPIKWSMTSFIKIVIALLWILSNNNNNNNIYIYFFFTSSITVTQAQLDKSVENSQTLHVNLLKKYTKQCTRQCKIQSLFDQYPLAIAYQPWITAPSNCRFPL